ncbi:hypothetical protein JL721_6056 [Aureococcus anophagefferens]|nr:hypothetical protein JL721_6056 [Aureococcus anophagefferens]
MAQMAQALPATSLPATFKMTQAPNNPLTMTMVALKPPAPPAEPKPPAAACAAAASRVSTPEPAAPTAVVTAGKDRDAVRACLAALNETGNARAVAPSCVKGALAPSSALVQFFAEGPLAVVKRVVAGGRGDVELESFSRGTTTWAECLDDEKHAFTPATPAVDAELHALLEDAAHGGRSARAGPRPEPPSGSSSPRGAPPDKLPCLAGLPKFARDVYDAYDDDAQFLVLQPGPGGDLRPHVDYLASGVLYMLLHGRKRISVWAPSDANLATLADGYVEDRDVEADLGGDRWTIDAEAGDAVFIPPGCPHVVRNVRGGSVAWGLNVVAPASHALIEAIRDGNLTDEQKKVLAHHYFPRTARARPAAPPATDKTIAKRTARVRKSTGERVYLVDEPPAKRKKRASS